MHCHTASAYFAQAATHGEVGKLPVFFTVSTTGVTRTMSLPALGTTATEFLTLEQFRREHRLHSKLMQLRVFRCVTTC